MGARTTADGRGSVHSRARNAILSIAAAAALVPGGVRATPLPSYLSQFVLMMDWVNRSVAYVSRHSSDTDLAGVAQAVAESFVEKAQRLTPPDELVDLHPHFLLVLENVERAFHYLAEGDAERAEHHMELVRLEIRNLRQIQHDIRIEIPELNL